MELLPFLCSLGLVGLLASMYKFRVLRRANKKQMAIHRRRKLQKAGLGFDRIAATLNTEGFKPRAEERWHAWW